MGSDVDSDGTGEVMFLQTNTKMKTRAKSLFFFIKNALNFKTIKL